jgi:hypothetical protein
MRPGRWIVALVLVAGTFWLWKNKSKLLPADSAGPARSAPADSQLSEAAREAEKSSGTGITENMTPDQVRGVLGSPDEVESFTSESGKPGEKWTYRQAHRMVVFENGIAVSVQPI